jgi:predicted amidohydrolase
MAIVKIALANLPYAASPDESITKAEAAIADAARLGATVVCFPESYVPGYRGETVVRPAPEPEFLKRAWQRIGAAAAKAKVAVVLGTERYVNGRARITALVFGADGTRAGFQDKVQLDPSEDSLFEPGTERRVFEAGALRFGVSICHEGWRYPETVRWPAKRGAHVVFHPHYHWAEPGAFRPERFGDARNTFHESVLRGRAAENTCYVASVNYASDGSPTTSAVVAPDGTVIAWQPYGREGLLVADVDTVKATGLMASRHRADVAG